MQRHVLQLRERRHCESGWCRRWVRCTKGISAWCGSPAQRADVVVATIFVNPTQFGPQEDFARYPRTLDADLQALSAAGCDLVFVPAADDIYPPGFSTYVEPPAVAQPLEGVCRPGHFRGVATVVLKLFQSDPGRLWPASARRTISSCWSSAAWSRDLNVPIEIVACPTVREPDGLAMSSRNRYLSPAERQQALALSRALDEAEQLVAGGERERRRDHGRRCGIS